MGRSEYHSHEWAGCTYFLLLILCSPLFHRREHITGQTQALMRESLQLNYRPLAGRVHQTVFERVLGVDSTPCPPLLPLRRVGVSFPRETQSRMTVNTIPTRLFFVPSQLPTSLFAVPPPHVGNHYTVVSSIPTLCYLTSDYARLPACASTTIAHDTICAGFHDFGILHA